MNKTIDNIVNRVSCRSYSDKKVPLSKLNHILEARKYAPSGMNRQPCHILVIRNKRVMEKLRSVAVKEFGRDPFYGANTVCIVYGKKNEPLVVQDGSCILENMFIAARSLGIDSCWIHCVKDIVPSNLTLSKLLGISDDYRVIGSCILGYHNEGIELKVKTRKEDFIKII